MKASIPAPVSATEDSMRKHAAFLACRKCVLPPGSHPVFSVYRGQKFMLVGQAPGKEELVRGYPFAGAAGKNLFRWFAEAGLGDEATVRSRMYITSIAHCWPGSRPGSKDDLPPSRLMLENCAEHLTAELAMVAPRWVVAIGAMAVQTVLGRKATLGEVVGKVHRVTWGGVERNAVVLPHPSGLSRWLNDPKNLAKHTESLRLLRAAWQAPENQVRITGAGA